MKKILLVVVIILIAFSSQAQKNKNPISIKDSSKVVIQQLIIWGATGKRCQNGGLYCYIVQGSQPGDCISKMQLTVGDTIVITTTGNGSLISKETMEAFKNKKIPIRFEDIPNDYYKKLFESVGLSSPEKNISFKKADQYYRVINTKNSNAVIEITQKTKIIIKKKVYILKIITISGKI
jgi:hypothetical protein